MTRSEAAALEELLRSTDLAVQELDSNSPWTGALRTLSSNLGATLREREPETERPSLILVKGGA